MTFAVLATSAIAPSLLLVGYFHARDAFPEPPRVLWRTFGLGVVIVAPVLLFAWPAFLLAEEIDSPLAHGFVGAFFGAAIPEELFKLLVLWGYSMRQRDFDEPMDGIVYGATASLGFATFENVLYVTDGGGSTAVLRALTAVPGHAFLGAIMGYYVGRARFAEGRERRSLMAKALTVPTLLHGAYDFPLLAASRLEEPDSAAALPVLALLLLVPAILALEWIWTVRLVGRGRLAQLAGSAAPGGPPGAEPAPALDAEPAAATAAARPAATRPAAVRPSARERPGRIARWVLTLLGALFASGGSLMILAVLLGVMVGGADAEETAPLVLGTIIVGVIPAAVGCGMFLWGVQRLNRA